MMNWEVHTARCCRKFPVKSLQKDEDDDEFAEWEEEDKKNENDKQPTGLREIKSIKY